jgi:hypothetical protein
MHHESVGRVLEIVTMIQPNPWVVSQERHDATLPGATLSVWQAGSRAKQEGHMRPSHAVPSQHSMHCGACCCGHEAGDTKVCAKENGVTHQTATLPVNPI